MSLKVFQDPLLKVTYHIILMINGLHLLWFPMFIALEIYSFFGTKFSWNEGTGTCVNFVCVLVDRNFDFLGGYCLLPSGYYWLLLVTWCLLLVTGGYCSLLVVTARYLSLLLVPTFTMNGQKFRSNFNVKYILFQKIRILSQQQPNFTSSYEKHGGINSSTSNSKKDISKQKIPKCVLAGRIKEFLPVWKQLTKDQKLLILVAGYQGYRIPLLMEPVQEKFPKLPKLNQEQQKQENLEAKTMLEKGSISKVSHSKWEFLSSLFLISKKGGGNRPVINLKDPNRFSPYKHFQMDGLHCLKYELRKRDSMCKIDLKGGYFSVPLHKDSRNLVRFHWAGNLYEFLCLCFCFGTSSQIIHVIDVNYWR